MIPEMLEKLDYGLISFHPAFEIAFLKPNEQRMLLDAMDYAQSAPSVSQAQRIKKLSQMNKLTLEAMQNILSEVKKGDLERVAFKSGQLRKFFLLMLSWVVMISPCHAVMRLPGYLSWNVPFDGAAVRPITKGISSYIHALPAL